MLLSTAASARKHTSSFKSRVQTGNARILDKDFPFSMFGGGYQQFHLLAITEMLGVKPDDLRLIVLGWILPLIFYGALLCEKSCQYSAHEGQRFLNYDQRDSRESCNQGSTLSNEDDPATPEAPWTPPQSSSLASSSECSTPHLDLHCLQSQNECVAAVPERVLGYEAAALGVWCCRNRSEMASSASDDSSSSANVAPNGERAPSCRDSPVALKKGQRIHSDLDRAQPISWLLPTERSARKVLSANLRVFRERASRSLSHVVLDHIFLSRRLSIQRTCVRSTSSASTKHVKRRLEFGRIICTSA